MEKQKIQLSADSGAFLSVYSADKGDSPGVLVLPGGAYLSCCEREGEPVALKFREAGYAAFVLEYSTGMRSGGLHPAPVREVALAMKLIRDRGAGWGCDADRVALCGFSAGAHNAAMYAVYYDKPLVCEYTGIPGGIAPAALILCYPVTDYVTLRELTGGHMHPAVQDSYKAFFGTYDPSPAALAEASPARLADKSMPPVFIWATADDAIVPVQNSLLMEQACREKGVPCELHIFPHGEHGLGLATREASPDGSHVNDSAAQWFPLCLSRLSDIMTPRRK